MSSISMVNGGRTCFGYARLIIGLVGTILTCNPVSSYTSLRTAWTGSSLGSICPPGGSHALIFLCQCSATLL